MDFESVIRFDKKLRNFELLVCHTTYNIQISVVVVVVFLNAVVFRSYVRRLG